MVNFMSEEDLQKAIKLLTSDTPILRQYSLQQISKNKNRHRALNEVINTLINDEDKDVRSYSAEILGDIGDEIAATSLVKMLKDESWEVRESILIALSKLQDSQIITYLITALEDEHTKVRFTAVKQLSKINNPIIISPLFDVLLDESDSVREEAKKTLLGFSETIPVSSITQYLRHSSKIIREFAVDFLSGHIDGDIIAILNDFMNDYDREIRLAALKELSKIAMDLKEKDSRLIDIGLNALSDKHYSVRFEAVKFLEILKDSKAIEPLIERARNDEDHNVQLKATETITAIRRALRLNET